MIFEATNQHENFESVLQKVSEYEDCMTEVDLLIDNLQNQISDEKNCLENIKVLFWLY